jgi:hypothetical protein
VKNDGCTLEREAAFWLVSGMFIFISAKMQKKIGAGVLGGLLKKMVIHRNNQIQYTGCKWDFFQKQT